MHSPETVKIGIFRKIQTLALVAASLVFTSAAHGQTCADLFQSSSANSFKSSGAWGGVRDAGQALYDRVRRTKIEADFESSFTPSERRALREIVDVAGRPDVVRRLDAEMSSWDSENPFFLYVFFEKMSAESRAVLTRVLDSRLTQRKGDRIGDSYDLIQLVSGSPVKRSSFVGLVVENWAQDTRFDLGSFSRWMEAHREMYLQRQARGEFEARDFQERLWKAYERTLAAEFWRRTVPLSEFGVRPDAGGALFIGSRYLAKIESVKDGVVILQVPRESIKRAAWNPISNEVIRKKIQMGFRNVRNYDAFLAADGYFYLLDGNHRFLLDERGKVSIKISHPISVSSLSDTLDALGIPQPRPDALVLFQQGRLALEGLVGEAGARRLILVQPPRRD